MLIHIQRFVYVKCCSAAVASPRLRGRRGTAAGGVRSSSREPSGVVGGAAVLSGSELPVEDPVVAPVIISGSGKVAVITVHKQITEWGRLFLALYGNKDISAPVSWPSVALRELVFSSTSFSPLCSEAERVVDIKVTPPPPEEILIHSTWLNHTGKEKKLSSFFLEFEMLGVNVCV